MKRVWLWIAVAIMAMALPASAQWCQSCGADSRCYPNPGSGTWCEQGIDYCIDWGGCDGFSPSSNEVVLAAEWTVASVEIETPAGRQIETKDEVRTAEAVPVQIE